MEFKFKADAKFEAKNLDNACEKLSNHFKAIRNGERDTGLEFIGEMHLVPEGNTITLNKGG